MAYSIEIRNLVLNAMNNGMSGSEIARTFGVSIQTQFRWKTRFERTGVVERDRFSPGAPPHISTEVFRFYMNSPENQVKTQSEIAADFGESTMTICNMMKKIGYTRKKKPSHTKSQIP